MDGIKGTIEDHAEKLSFGKIIFLFEQYTKRLTTDVDEHSEMKFHYNNAKSCLLAAKYFKHKTDQLQFASVQLVFQEVLKKTNKETSEGRTSTGSTPNLKFPKDLFSSEKEYYSLIESKNIWDINKELFYNVEPIYLNIWNFMMDCAEIGELGNLRNLAPRITKVRNNLIEHKYSTKKNRTFTNEWGWEAEKGVFLKSKEVHFKPNGIVEFSNVQFDHGLNEDLKEFLTNVSYKLSQLITQRDKENQEFGTFLKCLTDNNLNPWKDFEINFTEALEKTNNDITRPHTKNEFLASINLIFQDIINQLNSKFDKKFKVRNIRITDDFFKIPFEEYKKGFEKLNK